MTEINRERVKKMLFEKVQEYKKDNTKKDVITYYISLVFSEIDKKLTKNSLERKEYLQEFYQILPEDLKNHLKIMYSTLKRRGILI